MTPRPMPAASRSLLPALATLTLLAAACEREPAATDLPPAAPVTAPVADDPNWALKALPRRVPLPEITHPDQARQPLDHFILAGLEAHHLAPAPEAPPLTWFRRASIHLTGLPPTPDAVRDFQAALDSSQGKDPQEILESTADRLLASPAFGDQLATLWLDAVRHTDRFDTTTGHLNGQWPYRDWVIDSFNANLPYDEFLTAQLAGDLLDAPTPGQLLATAFLRAHPLDHGGDLAPAEVIRRNTSARTDALGQGILGLPLECSRCHDAPDGLLTRSEYLSLASFFDSLAEGGLPVRPGVVPAPTLALPNDEQLAAISACADAEASTAKLLRQARLDGEDAFQAWHSGPRNLPVIPDLAAAFTFDERSPRSPNRTLTGTGFANRGPLPLIAGISGMAVQCDGEHPVTISDLFPLTRWSEWTFSFWVKDREVAPGSGILLSHGPGVELHLNDGQLLATLHRDLPGNAIAACTPEPVVPGDAWTHLAWSYDGSNTPGGLRLFVNGRPAATTALADQLWGDPLTPGAGPAGTLLGARDGVPGFIGGIDDFQAFTRALSPLEVAHLHDGTSLPDARRGAADEALRDYYFSSIDEISRTLRRQLALDRKATLEVERSVHEVAVARERLTSRTRSSSRSLPAFLPQLPADPLNPDRFTHDRLSLARSLTRPDHSLTARVFVNRLWALFFGRGLVATTRNLGPSGAPPTHPELLDWLARDFIAHGWDIKHLCRRIVLSSTYRQASQPRGEQVIRDPDNILLGRYPAHPLPPLAGSEFLLAITGRLDSTRGGPPGDVSARAPYTIWSPPLRSHDADATACPLGAKLTPTFLESLLPPDEPSLLTASRLLAEHTLDHVPTDTGRLRILFATLASRFPNDAEQAGLDECLAELRARADADDAPQLVQPHGTPSGTAPAELAVWSELARAILRSDTPLWIR